MDADERERRPEPDAADEQRQRVEVVFEVSETTALANLLAHQQAPARPPRPLRGALGAFAGAALGAVLWLAAMPFVATELPLLIPGALAVAILAGVGAIVLGGRGRASQLAATVAALIAVLALRLVWAYLEVRTQQVRLIAHTDASPDLVRLLGAQLEQQLGPAALARRVLDGVGLATYIVAAGITWRIAKGTR